MCSGGASTGRYAQAMTPRNPRVTPRSLRGGAAPARCSCRGRPPRPVRYERGAPTSRRACAELARPAVRSPLPSRAGGGARASPPRGRAACCARATGSWSRSASSAAPLAGARGAARRRARRILHASRRYQTVTVAARPAELRALGASPGSAASRGCWRRSSRGRLRAARSTSEGDAQLERRRRPRRLRRRRQRRHGRHPLRLLRPRPDGRRPTPPTTSPAATCPAPATPAAATTPVDVLDDSCATAEPTDEGRGMAQIVHDLAPGAEISFATAFKGEIGLRRQHRSSAPHGGANGDRRRRRLLRRALLPGRPGRRRDRRSRRRRRRLLHGGRQRQPVRRPKATTIASWEAPEFRDTRRLPGAARSRVAGRRQLPRLRPRRRRQTTTPSGSPSTKERR